MQFVEGRGRKALKTLVAQNLGLVMSIVKKYEDKGVQASDLVQVRVVVVVGGGGVVVGGVVVRFMARLKLALGGR